MQIVVENLVKNYFFEKEEIRVLKGLSFSVASGSLVSLTGPSGVGKSTLLHVIGTLDTPSSGTVVLDGVATNSLSQEELAGFRNDKIGFVFQFHHLLPELSAVENVQLPLLIRRENSKLADEKARYLLERVGLAHRTSHKPGELSGGEQQRVALARALVSEPKLILADEPTGNLDEATGNQIFDLLCEFNEADGITTLIATHHQRISSRTPLRLVLSQDGISANRT